MALARIGESIVEGLFGDIVPSVRNAVRGYTMVDDEPMLSRLVKPEIMTGAEGTSRVMDMPEFQGVTQAERQTNLELATQMAKEGADNRDIAARTGFGFYEGQPMLEIDDSAAELSKPLTELDVKKKYKAPDILKHDDFYKVYPEMKKLKVEFYDGDPPTSEFEDNGYFDFDKKTIGINKNAWFMGDPNFGALYYEQPNEEVFKTLMKTMLHEAQHAVQQVEKLPGGASASDFMKGGDSGLELSQEDAQKRYAKVIGEMWARNVAERFKKTTKDNPWQTLGKDPESEKYGFTAKDAILESGIKTNPFVPYEELNYQDPFPDTTKENF
jgi:hypothetical protein